MDTSTKVKTKAVTTTELLIGAIFLIFASAAVLFTSETQYSLSQPKKILEPIWKSPKDETLHTILE